LLETPNTAHYSRPDPANASVEKERRHRKRSAILQLRVADIIRTGLDNRAAGAGSLD